MDCLLSKNFFWAIRGPQLIIYSGHCLDIFRLWISCNRSTAIPYITQLLKQAHIKIFGFFTHQANQLSEGDRCKPFSLSKLESWHVSKTAIESLGNLHGIMYAVANTNSLVISGTSCNELSFTSNSFCSAISIHPQTSSYHQKSVYPYLVPKLQHMAIFFQKTQISLNFKQWQI